MPRGLPKQSSFPWNCPIGGLQRSRCQNWTKLMVEARRSPPKDNTDIKGSHCLVVEARFYDDIQDALFAGAVAELDEAGVTHDVVTVPGCLEIPAATAIAIEAAERAGRPYDAVVALGCVIRGETIHFEIVSMESARGL